jgi:hypothetical protein
MFLDVAAVTLRDLDVCVQWNIKKKKIHIP